MCMVSAVIDYGMTRVPDTVWSPNIFHNYMKIIDQTSKLDKALGQPDCEDPKKKEFLDELKKKYEPKEEKVNLNPQNVKVGDRVQMDWWTKSYVVSEINGDSFRLLMTDGTSSLGVYSLTEKSLKVVETKEESENVKDSEQPDVLNKLKEYYEQRVKMGGVNDDGARWASFFLVHLFGVVVNAKVESKPVHSFAYKETNQ